MLILISQVLVQAMLLILWYVVPQDPMGAMLVLISQVLIQAMLMFWIRSEQHESPT